MLFLFYFPFFHNLRLQSYDAELSVTPFLCRLQSIAAHRDHLVLRLSVRLSIRPSVCLCVCAVVTLSW